jgi:hypothetical protein
MQAIKELGLFFGMIFMCMVFAGIISWGTGTQVPGPEFGEVLSFGLVMGLLFSVVVLTIRYLD